jgi:hypothetical protein
MAKLKMVFNGIRCNGELIKGSWIDGRYRNKPEGTVAFYAEGYSRVPVEVARELAVKVHNETDTMTDYFETDRFYIQPGHKYYEDVMEAVRKKQERFEKRMAKRMAKAQQRVS